MKIAAAALVVAAAVSGCGGPPETTPRAAAHLTVGNTTRTVSPAVCKRDQQYQTIDVRDGAGRVEAVMLISGQRVIPQWVKIRGVDGFDGGAWQGGVGQVGEAHVDSQNRYTITGSASGFASSNPDKVVSMDFKIIAGC